MTQVAAKQTEVRQHTPGPWKADFNIEREYVEDSNGYCIARIAGRFAQGEAIANAAFIAAAPETAAERDRLKGELQESDNALRIMKKRVDKAEALNAELVAALEYIDRELSQHPQAYTTGMPVSFSIHRARAVLSKVKGE